MDLQFFLAASDCAQSFDEKLFFVEISSGLRVLSLSKEAFKSVNFISGSREFQLPVELIEIYLNKYLSNTRLCD